jgi:hypothetical protein
MESTDFSGSLQLYQPVSRLSPSDSGLLGKRGLNNIRRSRMVATCCITQIKPHCRVSSFGALRDSKHEILVAQEIYATYRTYINHKTMHAYGTQNFTDRTSSAFPSTRL